MNNPIRASLKALLLLAVLCFRSNIMLAQTEQVAPQGLEQGRWLVGGSLGGLNLAINEKQFPVFAGSSTTTRLFSSIGFSVGTNLGYFVTKNLVVGSGLGLNFSASGGENFSSGSSSLGVSVGPFMRYYFANIGSNAALFGGLGVNYAFTSQFLSTALGQSSPTTVQTINPALTLGTTWFVSRDVALELLVSYDRRWLLISEQRITTSSTLPPIVVPAQSNYNGSLRLGLGFQIFLDKVF